MNVKSFTMCEDTHRTVKSCSTLQYQYIHTPCISNLVRRSVLYVSDTLYSLTLYTMYTLNMMLSTVKFTFYIQLLSK